MQQALDAVDASDQSQPSSAVPGGRVKATIKTAPMTNDEFTAAAMSRAAYIQYNEGEDAVRKYAAKNVGDGWTYDPELSNEMAVVFSRGNESAIA